MLDIKHQSGLLEAEQNLLQTSAGFNWDSAWQQIHALIRRMKWSFFFRTIKCSPVWRLDKTAARDNSETVKPPDVTVTHCLIDNLYSQPLLYQHIHISVTLQQKVWGWLVCPHTVSDSVAKKQIQCSYFITSVNWCKGFTVAVKPALYPHVAPLAWSCSLPFVTKHFTGQHNKNSQSQDLKLMWEWIPKRGQNNANTTCKRKPQLWSGPLLQRQLHGQIKLNAS